MATQPHARGIYVTPLTQALQIRDVRKQKVTAAAELLLRFYPSISLMYLLDVLVTAYQPPSQNEFKDQLPKVLQDSNELDAALEYAFPPATSYEKTTNFTQTGIPYVDKVNNLGSFKPEITVRDSFDPNREWMSCSPDVIANPISVDDYKNYYGASGSSNWDREFSTGGQVESDKPSYIYVRLENTGNVPIVPYLNLVYVEPYTLIHFEDAHPVGHHFSDKPLQPGEKDIVKIVWEGPHETNHFCFIAIVESPRYPVFVPPIIEDLSALNVFVKKYKNVAWHNFMVVNNVVDQTHIPLPKFHINPIGHETYLTLSIADEPDLASSFPPGSAIQAAINNELYDLVLLDDNVTDDKGRLIITPNLYLDTALKVDIMLNVPDGIGQAIKFGITQISGGHNSGAVNFQLNPGDQIVSLPNDEA